MPKQKPEEVSKLLSNMKGEATRARGPQKAEKKPAAQKAYGDPLHRTLDLSPYKEHKDYPGNAYMLVGNSYNMEHYDNAYNKRRARNVSKMFEHFNGIHYLSVEDALCYAPFVDTLSRFEFDWLRREASSSQIGPAYDQYGKHVPASFAVWRLEAVQNKQRAHYTFAMNAEGRTARAPRGKQLVGAK